LRLPAAAADEFNLGDKTMKMQDMRRRPLVSIALVLPLAAWADDRLVEWRVGCAAGAGSDFVARSVAEPMSACVKGQRERWGLLVKANPIRLD
jgi:hypothetical protein